MQRRLAGLCASTHIACAALAVVEPAMAGDLQAQLPTPAPARQLRPPPDSLVAVTVKVTSGLRPVEAAVVRSGTGLAAVAAQTDVLGIAILRLRAGERLVVASRVGYRPDSITVVVRAAGDTTVTLELRAAGADPREKREEDEKAERAATLAGVVVTATRSQRRVEAEPTRVDVLDREEVEEQTAMTPGDVSRFLGETGGVRVATTSPGFGAANVRVQGLRGRYTLLLSDGLPLYGLTTEGLGLLQIPPIDLRQVELIKGASTALYGPGALGGVINFASRRPPVLLPDRPRETRELYLNQTTLDGTDVALFDARTLTSHWGYTLLATGNRQAKRDLNDDGWADVAGYRRGVVRPRLFWTGADGSDVFVTTGVTAEDRRGGTVAGTRPAGVGNTGPGTLARDTRRADAGAVAHVMLGAGRVLALRGSATSEWRHAAYGAGAAGNGAAVERDRRSTLFAEAALTVPVGTTQEWVLGAAAQRDGYTPRDVPALGYVFAAPALFAQHTWTPSRVFGLTSSARLDAHSRYGTTLNPRLSALFRPWAAGLLAAVAARISGGTGTYAPTPFVEDLEEVGLRRLRLIGSLRAERARNASADIGGLLGSVEVNAAVYASVIDHAVGLRTVDRVGTGPILGDSVELVNAARPTRTGGAQLFARYRDGPYRVTGSYDYQRATEQDVESEVAGQRRGVPLTPRHSAKLTASWETADDAGLSVEAFYTGRQPLADDPYRSVSRPYVIVGALARMRVGRSILYINVENIGNVRQTQVDPLLRRTPGLGGRWTTDVWAPLDGAVLNAGARLGF